jgi:hypothetical protein
MATHGIAELATSAAATSSWVDRRYCCEIAQVAARIAQGEREVRPSAVVT